MRERGSGFSRQVRVMCLLVLSIAQVGCGSIFVAGGGSLDSSTFEVSGVKTDFGGQAEVGFQNGSDGAGLGGYLSTGLLGYKSPGDADPIFQTLLEVRYRRMLGTPSQSIRPFYALGVGSGVVYVAGPGASPVTLHGEVGAQLTSGPMNVYASIRERPALLAGRSVDFLNSLQVFLGVGVGSSR